MKKRLFNSILFTTFAALSIVTSAVMSNAGDTYWYNTGVIQDRVWMHGLPDTQRVSDLSLPATNDSLAYSSNLDHWQRTQTMNLRYQLRSGIRVFDIGFHANAKAGVLTPHNGARTLPVSIEEPFLQASTYITENPSETVFINLNQQGSSVDQNTLADLFESTYTKYKQYLYTGNSKNPTLGELRGKIVLLSNTDSFVERFHAIDTRTFHGSNAEVYLQNKSHLYDDRWFHIKNRLNSANSIDGQGLIYVNNMGGYGPVTEPYFVASGYNTPTNTTFLGTMFNDKSPTHWPDFPRINGRIFYAGMNPLSTEHINQQALTYTGMVYADFPGKGLINAIIAANHR